MVYRYSYLLLFMSWIITTCRINPIAKKNLDKYKDFQVSIDSIYNLNPEVVGIMVHVESPSKNFSWSGCAGYADKDHITPLSPDQPAHMASSIKTYVAASILRLHEENKLTVGDLIKNHLTLNTRKLLAADSYNLDSIRIIHLLSHRSGIDSYADKSFFSFVSQNPSYKWTRNELIKRTIDVGSPVGRPEERFKYSDTNYLLCAEIIEEVTGKAFHQALQELLRFDQLGFHQTWFPTLEEDPKNLKPMVHQYHGDLDWDSYDINVTWDLYGGGGLATTSSELAQFSYHLFNGNIIEDEDILNVIFTKVPTQSNEADKYYLGIAEDVINGYKNYGHSGFWGSDVRYFPEFDTSISLFILNKYSDGTSKAILESLIKKIEVQLSTKQLH